MSVAFQVAEGIRGSERHFHVNEASGVGFTTNPGPIIEGCPGGAWTRVFYVRTLLVWGAKGSGGSGGVQDVNIEASRVGPSRNVPNG